MTNQEYHSDTSAISKSGLDLIESSPLDYWYHYLSGEKPEEKPTEAMLFGTALHTAVLEPEMFEKQYVIMPYVNKRTNVGKAEFKALQNIAIENNKVFIDSDDMEKILKMREQIFKHPTAKLLFANGLAEQTFMFLDPETGAKCKIRPDWIDNNNGLIVDLKSTTDASKEGFSKHAFNFKYHKQDAFYLDGLEILGQEKAGFIFVNIEKEPPFKIGIHYLDERSRQLGRDTCRKNLQTYTECLRTGIWKGYDEKISEVSLPEWAFNK